MRYIAARGDVSPDGWEVRAPAARTPENVPEAGATEEP